MKVNYGWQQLVSFNQVSIFCSIYWSVNSHTCAKNLCVIDVQLVSISVVQRELTHKCKEESYIGVRAASYSKPRSQITLKKAKKKEAVRELYDLIFKLYNPITPFYHKH